MYAPSILERLEVAPFTEIFFQCAVALDEYQKEKVLQALFQFLLAYNVVFTLNLIYVLGVIKRIVFGVVSLTASFRDFSIITIPWP